MGLREDLIQFIQQNLIEEEGGSKIDENESLIDRGLIDSIGLMQLMTHIEESTGVRIPDDMVAPEHFDTVVNIERMVQDLRSKQAPSS